MDFDFVLLKVGGGSFGGMIDGIPVGLLEFVLDGGFDFFNVFVVLDLVLEVEEFL